MIKGFLNIFGRRQPKLHVRRGSRLVGSDSLRTIVGAKRPVAASIGDKVLARAPWLLSRPRMAAGFVVAIIGLAFLPIEGRPLASQGVQSVLDMLNARSPGSRGEGRLTDTKPARASFSPKQRTANAANPPRERALGKVFAPPAIAPIGGEMPFNPPFEPNFLDVASVPGLPVGAPFGGGGGGGAGGPGGAIGAPGGGGTPGGGTPGGGTGSPPVAAVPEPGTWLMMIIAFGSCGFMLRRQRRASANRSTCKSAG